MALPVSGVFSVQNRQATDDLTQGTRPARIGFLPGADTASIKDVVEGGTAHFLTGRGSFDLARGERKG